MDEQSGSTIPKRRVVVEFLREDGKIAEYDSKFHGGLDVKFMCSKLGNMIMNRAKISICNLRMEDINYLCTWTYWSRAMLEKKIVRLKAGYGEDLAEIFDGYVITAYPTMPPDIWIEMDVIQNFDQANQDIVIDSLKEPVTLESILKIAESRTGLKYVPRLDPEDEKILQKKIAPFSFSGNVPALFSEIVGYSLNEKNIPAISIYSQSGQMIVRSSYEVRKIRYDASGINSGLHADFVCSAQTGMIGIPRPSPMWIDVHMRLNNRVGRRDIMDVYSDFYDISQKTLAKSAKQAGGAIAPVNGLYDVFNVTHSGHLRGEQFMTTIRARRIDATYQY